MREHTFRTKYGPTNRTPLNVILTGEEGHYVELQTLVAMKVRSQSILTKAQLDPFLFRRSLRKYLLDIYSAL